MMQLVPLGGSPYPLRPSTLPAPGVINGVFIILPPDYAGILEKMSGWFANRLEVAITDHGNSDKHGFGYIMIEWSEFEIDQLFLDILQNEDAVADYSTYIRELEEE